MKPRSGPMNEAETGTEVVSLSGSCGTLVFVKFHFHLFQQGKSIQLL